LKLARGNEEMPYEISFGGVEVGKQMRIGGLLLLSLWKEIGCKK
jgi:hypothetical protein